MSEMVEKVARAIYEGHAWGDEHSENGKGWEATIVGTGWHEAYRNMARAAIEAMREPTEAMIEAGVSAETGKTMGSRVTYCWQSMLDAALPKEVKTDG